MDVNGMLAIVVELTVIFAAGVAGYRGLRKWVAAQAAPAREANAKLRTKNGHTIAQLVEAQGGRLDRLIETAKDAQDLAGRAYDRAWRALQAAEAATDRIDRHLVRDHSEGDKP